MTNNKGYILVEGQGEVAAAQNLIARLSADLGLFQPWAAPRRWVNLQHWNPKRQGVMRAAEFIRTKPDAGSLLILRDEDSGCPATIAPTMAGNLRALNLPFPAAFVLLRPEYEVLFLPCMAKMGAAGFPDGVKWPEGSWEAKRDVKGWLSAQLPRGRRYKPRSPWCNASRPRVRHRGSRPRTETAAVPGVLQGFGTQGSGLEGVLWVVRHCTTGS